MLSFACAHCGQKAERPAGHVNRSRRQGLALYCSRECSGLGRRKHKTEKQKKEEKRLYDIEYRQKNRAALKRKKADYYQRTRDPVAEAEKRKERMPRHVEYCRRPEYRKWKKQYDRQYRAKKFYGEFWESFLLAQDIRQEALKQQDDYDIRLSKGTLCKVQRRKRDYERSERQKLEANSLGNLELGQRR